MHDATSVTTGWMLDSSTFIHAMAIDRVALVVLLRGPAFFTEYVFRFELGENAHTETREHAEFFVYRNQIQIRQLTIDDLDRIATLAAPRRIGMGEIGCAVVALREERGVLCDDWKAKAWFDEHLRTPSWQSIEDVLVDAASRGHIGESDLPSYRDQLKAKKYDCRYDMHFAYLQRLYNSH